MIGTLMTHCGAVQASREDLRAIPPPPATRTWRPVSHIELIETLEQEIGRRSLQIRNEAYAIQQDGALLFGVIDLAWRQTQEFTAAIGLRTSNNKMFSIQLAIGFRIFVCDNLAFSGDLIALRRKHTARLDLRSEMAQAMDRYQEGIFQLERKINRLKEVTISHREAKVLIFDAFAQHIMPVRFFQSVQESFFAEPHDGIDHQPPTLWTLHNVFTSHIRRLPPGVAFASTVRLGKLVDLGTRAVETEGSE